MYQCGVFQRFFGTRSDQRARGQIPERAAELAGEVPLATICEGGYRSSLGASLLARQGVPKVVSVTGGMAAYRAVGAT